VSDLVLDVSLTLQWFLEDEADRKYSLGVLASLSEKRALVPILWFYEVGNGLVMAHRRKRNKCLEKDRDLRCQSASEIRTDLKRLKRDTDSGRISSSASRTVQEVTAEARTQSVGGDVAPCHRDAVDVCSRSELPDQLAALPIPPISHCQPTSQHPPFLLGHRKKEFPDRFR